MPVEIREITIRTDVSTGNRERAGALSAREIEKLKQQIRNECMQMLSANTKKTGYKR
jgi:hypothetical protein